MLHEIKCATCGAARKTRFRNTKYCARCRLLDDLIYVRDRLYECGHEGCREHFAPVAISDKYCPLHAYASGRFGVCPFCKEQAELHRADLPLCVTCVRDPQKRTDIIASLQRGQRQRQEANGMDTAPRRRAVRP